jgi:hypothetical protein
MHGLRVCRRRQDNGAYYYYNGGDAELRAVRDEAQRDKIPFRYVLLDSWWCVQPAADVPCRPCGAIATGCGRQTAQRVRVRVRRFDRARRRYYKGIGGGVKNWTATPDTFPAGLRAFHDYTRWPIVGHNRFWAPDTDYATANGGKYAPAARPDPARPGSPPAC